MRTLEFIVDENGLSKNPDCDFSNIPNFLKAKFIFKNPESWEKGKIAVGFVKGENDYPVMLDDKNECDVPDSVLNGVFFYVYLAGIKDGKLVKTNKVMVIQR